MPKVGTVGRGVAFCLSLSVLPAAASSTAAAAAASAAAAGGQADAAGVDLAAAESAAHDRLQRTLEESALAAETRPQGAVRADAGTLISGLTRRVITGDVVEYSARLRVGTGPHDVIGLHRVVRESAPFVARPSAHALLMAHGDAWGFDAAFLSNLEPSSPPEAAAHALPVFLAANNVDVWGIDFRWTLVPVTTTDFTFMKDWGLTTDAGDLGIALAAARLTRIATGDGAQRLDLLGWSRGGQTSYVYLNAETQLPPALHQVAGFLPVDIYLKTDQADLRQAACARLAGEQAMLDAGTFQSTVGTLFDTLGALAFSDPGGASPVVAGLTNQQAALLAGAATYTLLPPGQAFVPFYHFTGGAFDAQGLPTGLTYTPASAWFTFLTGAAPFEPVKVLADADAIICGTNDLPGGDHLASVAIPVLYIGAGGGFGSFGLYNLSLLGSHQVETHVVSLQPAAARALDIGHVDIYTSTDAQARFWQPILTWLAGH